MQYYSEYFADAGIEKEQEVIQELGAPSELARRIIAEYRGRQPGEVKLNAKKKFPVGWIIFIAVAGSPIWLALLCVGIGGGAAGSGDIGCDGSGCASYRRCCMCSGWNH